MLWLTEDIKNRELPIALVRSLLLSDAKTWVAGRFDKKPPVFSRKKFCREPNLVPCFKRDLCFKTTRNQTTGTGLDSHGPKQADFVHSLFL